ncbi:MAG TPA: hypothetical protein VHM00_03140 [Caldimonas sp.]|nr:hypothetical protein [Caldimonas sp.]HEX2540059.1 hypothetical protein [Caldimonas sp.]
MLIAFESLGPASRGPAALNRSMEKKMPTGEKSTKTIDFWRWRQRDARTGTIRRSMFQPRRDEAGAFADARPPEDAATAGEGLDLELELNGPDFADTSPEIGRLED